MILGSSIQCCGIQELHGVNGRTFNPKSIMEFLAERKRINGRIVYAVLLMSDRVPRDTDISNKLRNLQRFVSKHKLGRICIQKAVRNPNSGNKIITALWHVNISTLSQYFKTIQQNRPSVTFTPPQLR